MAQGKVTWLGNGVAESLNVPDGEPVAIGGAITLTQGQVDALERSGHRFAKPGSDEAEEARRQAANSGQTTDPPQG